MAFAAEHVALVGHGTSCELGIVTQEVWCGERLFGEEGKDIIWAERGSERSVASENI